MEMQLLSSYAYPKIWEQIFVLKYLEIGEKQPEMLW